MAADRGVEGGVGQGHLRAQADLYHLPPIAQGNHPVAQDGKLHHDLPWCVVEYSCTALSGAASAGAASAAFTCCFEADFLLGVSAFTTRVTSLAFSNTATAAFFCCPFLVVISSPLLPPRLFFFPTRGNSKPRREARAIQTRPFHDGAAGRS